VKKRSGYSLVELLIVIAIVVLLIGGGIVGLGGCQSIKQNVKHLQSATLGLNRVITLYANDGSVIKTWETKTKVEVVGGIPRFITDSNKVVQLAGTYVIEEVPK